MSETLKTLIGILSDGEFHSGADLGLSLTLTRSAIWKHLKHFKTLGIPVESITGKGYRIPNGLSLLKQDIIWDKLSSFSQEHLNTLEIWDALPSTNDYLLTLKEKSNQTQVCLAERQTHGKGRRGRSWVSPFGQNIYLSLLWQFSRDVSDLSGLSLAVAIAVVQALQSYGIQDDLGLKWPNDVLWKNQKLAGILIELQGETHHTCNAVIGVGLNVNMASQYRDQITQPWTDIQTILGKRGDRNHITACLINALLKSLELFQAQGLSPFLDAWKALDLAQDQPVSIVTPQSTILGIGRGVTQQGHFLLEDPNGTLKTFSNGEVSLRLTRAAALHID